MSLLLSVHIVQFAESLKATAQCCIGERPQLLYGEQDESAREFLRTVRDTSASRCRRLPKGGVLFRAQLAFDLDTEPVFGFNVVNDGVERNDDIIDVSEREIPCSAERMLPDPNKVCDGRANRKGEPRTLSRIQSEYCHGGDAPVGRLTSHAREVRNDP